MLLLRRGIKRTRWPTCHIVHVRVRSRLHVAHRSRIECILLLRIVELASSLDETSRWLARRDRHGHLILRWPALVHANLLLPFVGQPRLGHSRLLRVLFGRKQSRHAVLTHMLRFRQTLCVERVIRGLFRICRTQDARFSRLRILKRYSC